jgi:hypothetical protein
MRAFLKVAGAKFKPTSNLLKLAQTHARAITDARALTHAPVPLPVPSALEYLKAGEAVRPGMHTAFMRLKVSWYACMHSAVEAHHTQIAREGRGCVTRPCQLAPLTSYELPATHILMREALSVGRRLRLTYCGCTCRCTSLPKILRALKRPFASWHLRQTRMLTCCG